MPAKKKAKKAVKRVAKKRAPTRSASDSGDCPPYGYPRPCPDSPCEFFTGVREWAKCMATWACEVDACYMTPGKCGTPARRAELRALCKAFSLWAKGAKKWADDVEECFQDKCGGGGGPPDHTQPPPPPF